VELLTGAGNDALDLSATTGVGFLFTNGADVSSGAGNDTIAGGSGSDNLRGEADNDSIVGGAGNDRLYGGTGNDTLDGGEGNDTLSLADLGNDSIAGGVGSDLLRVDMRSISTDVNFTYADPNSGPITGIEKVELLTGAGNDALDLSATTGVGFLFTNGADVSSGAGNDTIAGGSGSDNLRGEADNDSLKGGAGNDNLSGGTGNDTLDGVNTDNSNPGQGERDTLSGDTGADRFILGDRNNIYYDDRNTSTSGNNDYAAIADFNPTEGDVVQLQGEASNYRLETSGANTNLYVDKPGSEPDELIAVFQSITGLDINTFNFIPAVNNESVIPNPV
jgi:Ca2+-binding RTX toxin-like protein